MFTSTEEVIFCLCLLCDHPLGDRVMRYVPFVHLSVCAHCSLENRKPYNDQT